MKIIILEHPRLPSEPHFNDIANTPLWSCVLAGYVYSSLKQAGLTPVFLDANEQGLDFSTTAEEILRQNPDLLTINSVYFWEHTNRLFAMLADLRARNFKGHINLFGFFPTLHRQVLIDLKPIDSIAVGECEQTIVDLARNLAKHQRVEGLYTKNHPFTPRKQARDLDTIPFPHRTEKQLTSPASILASRGCYNHCSFCPIPSFYNDGPLWRGRSVENIIAEITTLIARGASEFYFIDPNFIGPGQAGKERVIDLLRQLRPLNIRFGMETRASDLDDELMNDLVQAGLNSLLMGIESGSSQSLSNFGKNETVHEGERGIAICRRAGIEPEIGFLMFSPESSRQSLLENLQFLERNNLLDRLDRTANLLCHSQIILASTTGFSQYQEQGILQKDDPFGFVGKVPFRDKQIETTAKNITSLCHFILRETGKKESPIYFKTTNFNSLKELNCLLVTEIRQHITEPEIADIQVSLQRIQEGISTLPHQIIDFPAP